MFEALYNIFLSSIALGMCVYMILPLLRRAPKKLDPLKEYDFRPLEDKVDEFVRLTRASDTEHRKAKTQLGIDRKVWDQKYQQFLHNDDPEKIHPKPKIDRASILTLCELPHRKSEVCHECDGDFEDIYNWSGQRVKRYKRRLERMINDDS